MMHNRLGESIALARDCDATLIPHGTPILLEKGTEGTVTQALGGSFTLMIAGNMVRIEGCDGDALGFEEDRTVELILDNGELSRMEKAWALVKTCYDPEIPVNIADLGLIYAINALDLDQPDSQSDQPSGAIKLHIVMTLTSPTCGMGPILTEEVKHKCARIEGVREVVIELVFEPPWSQELMSETAKLELGLL